MAFYPIGKYKSLIGKQLIYMIHMIKKDTIAILFFILFFIQDCIKLNRFNLLH